MCRALIAGLLVMTLVVLSAALAPAQSESAAPPTGPARAVQADAIVIGRVVALEDKDIRVNDVTYRIAIVKVRETLKGKKEETVRLGFVRPANAPPEAVFRAVPPHHLNYLVGDEGLFFLDKGPDGKFRTTHGLQAFVTSRNEYLKQEIDDAKLVVKIGDHPSKYLKSDSTPERLLAATLLIQTYRKRNINAKQEPIDAEESKLILKALAGAQWEVREIKKGTASDPRVHPYMLFSQLGLSAADGWLAPQNAAAAELYKAAREWLDKNWDSHRIQKYVGD